MRSFWDLNLGLGSLNSEKWRFGRQLEKRHETHVKKGHAGHAGNPPVVPLKNLQNADQQPYRALETLHWCPEGTVAD